MSYSSSGPHICIDVKIVKYRLHVCDAIDASIPATLMRCLLWEDPT